MFTVKETTVRPKRKEAKSMTEAIKENKSVEEKAQRYDEIMKQITPSYNYSECSTSPVGIVAKVNVRNILRICDYGYVDFVIET